MSLRSLLLVMLFGASILVGSCSSAEDFSSAQDSSNDERLFQLIRIPGSELAVVEILRREGYPDRKPIDLKHFLVAELLTRGGKFQDAVLLYKRLLPDGLDWKSMEYQPSIDASFAGAWEAEQQYRKDIYTSAFHNYAKAWKGAGNSELSKKYWREARRLGGKNYFTSLNDVGINAAGTVRPPEVRSLEEVDQSSSTVITAHPMSGLQKAGD